MARNVYDLPFDEDSSARFVPWIIALTTFVALVLIIGTMMLSSFMGRWSKDLRDHVTVQISQQNGTPEQNAHFHAQILHYLKKLPFVKEATCIEPQAVNALLEPWLGQGYQSLQLPLPSLISLTLRPHVPFDPAILSNELNKVAPGTIVHHHEQWHRSLLRFASAVQVIGHLIVALITLAAIGTLVFATYTGLIVHKDIIDILRLIGAKSDYIARQFQRHTLKLALKGVIYSLLFFIFVLLLMRWFVGHYDAQIPMEYVSIPALVMVVILVPLIVMGAMTITSRVTVRFVLNRDT